MTVRPVYWRAGSQGAPSADEAKRVEDAAGMYTGRLWLMAGGSYSVHVGVEGRAGKGIAVVSRRRSRDGPAQLSGFLRVLLVILGTLLVAGVITAVYAAVGESQVPPGEVVPPARRRARVSAPRSRRRSSRSSCSAARSGGTPKRRRMRTRCTRRSAPRSAVSDSAGAPMITLRVVDTNFARGTCQRADARSRQDRASLPRAHRLGRGARASASGTDRVRDVAWALPPLPAGRYRVFADVVHETGFQRTLVDSLTVRPRCPPAPRIPTAMTFCFSARSLSSRPTLRWATRSRSRGPETRCRLSVTRGCYDSRCASRPASR